MTQYQFRVLNKEQQVQTARKGNFIMQRQEENYTVVLYKVDAFYVEAYYNAATQLHKLHPFTSTERLQIYFKSLIN
jgi:hypothetical protein